MTFVIKTCSKDGTKSLKYCTGGVGNTTIKIKIIPIDAFSMSTKLINIWVNHNLILIVIVLGILVLLIIDLLLFLFLFRFEHTVALFGPELLTAGVICRD